MLTYILFQTEHEVVKGYDEKYNMEEEDSFENKDKEQEEERQKMESERSKLSPFLILYDYDKTKQNTPWAAKKHTEKTLSDCDVSGFFQCCKLVRYVANHVSCHRNHHRELHCYDSHRNHCS